MVAADGLLGPADVRAIAEQLDLRPSKQWGQNFVVDGNTVRRIVRTAELSADDVVLEVGPGLGSLTLGLLGAVERVIAVEVDARLARQLPLTVSLRLPERADRLDVIEADALRMTADDLPTAPTALVSNLPYNVAVPVVLHLLEALPSLQRGLVMVQAEVADRLAAPPGSRTYGIPSAKLRWYGQASRAGSVSPTVFWPEPRVESGLVSFRRGAGRAATPERDSVFAVVDAAFAQRRKTLRAALAAWAGGPAQAETLLRAAGVDPSARGETLSIDDFTRIAAARGT